ncbi:hypothetical protein FB567DRAFT_216965 [Paraphoma chrysanthemicola]|uniref:Uncharacterized protein n=1 Tax=Paraphoma chrysanthemicola TaxID=798071 RepID=A0A8K0QTG5_9PLEO|nr:hypothetical protein FB567DRAFT_216965 [Paraphoma chrysanthemicola]
MLSTTPPIPHARPSASSSSYGCPESTVRPDVNGWVPPGTCGYISRPYYPSFIAALVFSTAAAVVLAGFLHMIVRVARQRPRLLDQSTPSWRHRLLLPVFGTLISTCLLIAYVLRALGTRHQQVHEFVSISDTLVLMCPILTFALDCILLLRMTTTILPNENLAGVKVQDISRCLFIVIPLLAVEQLIASILIAPKHRPSPSRQDTSTAILGLKLYLVGIGIQGIIVISTIFLALVLHRRNRDREIETYEVKERESSDDCRSLHTWRLAVYALLFSLAAIATRITYRLVELSGIFTGYLPVLIHKEIFFYTLECLPVLAAVGVWTCVDGSCLEDWSSTSTAVGADGYHEISGELADDDLVVLGPVNVGT